MPSPNNFLGLCNSCNPVSTLLKVPSRTWKRSIQRFVITEKAPTWGLLRDCEIFANFRKAFVVSSSAQTIDIQPAPTPMRRERRNEIQLLPARPVDSSLLNCTQHRRSEDNSKYYRVFLYFCSWNALPWLGHFLQTLCVHCFRFILLIVTCFFTTMLVDFLNIKHFSPSEDVKCVSTALWSRDSFVILIFEPLLLFHMRQFLSQTPSFRFRQCASLQNHQPPGGRSWHRHYVAQHQGGGGQGGHRINYSYHNSGNKV